MKEIKVPRANISGIGSRSSDNQSRRSKFLEQISLVTGIGSLGKITNQFDFVEKPSKVVHVFHHVMIILLLN